MTMHRWWTAFAVAGVLIGGTALAGGGAPVGGKASAELGDGRAPPSNQEGFAGPSDNLRPLHPTRGPFFGIRVNSMDLKAAAKTIAWFEYECEGLRAGDAPQRYQLVRTAWRGGVEPNVPCDEVLALPLPASAAVTYEARMVTTRWMRDVGPSGTPVGGFVGELRIAARPADLDSARPPLPLFAFRLIGTTGLRPGRGDPDEPNAAADRRCASPLHDEGFYQGGVDKRGLAALLEHMNASVEAFAFARVLAASPIVGTFEGQLKLLPTADPLAYRYRLLEGGAWWFDGVLGYRCLRPHTQDYGSN